MTDDQESVEPAQSHTPVTTGEANVLESAPVPADVPPATEQAAVARPLEPADERGVDASPTPISALGERLTPFRLLVAATAILGVVSILLGLMVFAPSIAPIKLGATRLAAEAGDVQEIETISRRFARNFLTIDYQTLDADFARVLEDATGRFRNKIGGVLEVVGDLLRKAKSVSEGDVTSLTVLSRRGDNASVSARVDRTITNARTTDPRPTKHTLLITLVRTTSGWKVDDLTEIPASVGAGDVVAEIGRDRPR